MALEIEGKVFKKLTEQSGDGKNGKWVKQDFILETIESFPKKINFSAWGDKVDTVRSLQINDVVKVQFFAESREFNERWYTDLKVWRIDKLGDRSAVQPQNQTSVQQNSTVNTTENPGELLEQQDDLPF